MDVAQPARLGWGLLGAAAAAWFAVWFLFFPQFVPDYFAWDIEPRFAQVFIGAGYVFRTFFFLNAAFERSWLRLRWIVWGNLVFTGDPPVRHVLARRGVPLEPVRDAARPHLDRPLHLRARRDDLPHPAGHVLGAGTDLRWPDRPLVQAVPRPRHRPAPDERPPPPHQPGVRGDPLGVGAQPARRADGLGVVPRLVGVVRDDGLRAGLGRDPDRGQAVHPQRRRPAGGHRPLPRRVPAGTGDGDRVRRGGRGR